MIYKLMLNIFLFVIVELIELTVGTKFTVRIRKMNLMLCRCNYYKNIINIIMEPYDVQSKLWSSMHIYFCFLVKKPFSCVKTGYHRVNDKCECMFNFYGFLVDMKLRIESGFIGS